MIVADGILLLILLVVCVASMTIAIYLGHPVIMIIAMPIMMVVSLVIPDINVSIEV